MESGRNHSRGVAGLRRYRATQSHRYATQSREFFMAEFIYQMYQARKAHGDKVILDDVTLSF